MLLLFVLCATARVTRSWMVGLGFVLLAGGLAGWLDNPGLVAALVILFSFAGLNCLASRTQRRQQLLRERLVLYELTYPADPVSPV